MGNCNSDSIQISETLSLISCSKKRKNIRAIVDIETGGFSKTKNGVMEVGVVMFNEDYEIIGEYRNLILPYHRPQEEGQEMELVSYKDDAMKVNGLSVEIIEKDGVSVEEVTSDLIYIFSYYEINKVYAHNSKFDEGFLNVLFDRFGGGARIKGGIDCTIKLAKEKIKLNSYSLGNLCEHFGIEIKDAHTSLGDCRTTLKLLKKLEDVK